jgi:hypothetical protein
MTTTAQADDEEVVPALDLFCANESFLHLEEDWRRGLGWWLIDADGRKHVSIKDAIRLAPEGVAHEVILEAESLLWRLEAEDIERQVGPNRRNAIARFRREVAVAAGTPTSPMSAMLDALSLSPGRTRPPR